MRPAKQVGVTPLMPHSGHSRAIATRPGSFGFPVVSAAINAGRHGASADNTSPLIVLQAVALATFLMLQSSGASMVDGMTTTMACAFILILGLPHGARDLELIKREGRTGRLGMFAVLLLYLGLAAAMAAVWWLAPVAALAVFLIVSVIHFAEDWPELGSAFLAQGMAIALLTAPALLHLAELELLFEALSGQGAAAMVANVMLLLAPMSVAVAVLSIGILWRTDCRRQALAGALMLAGMILLPPVIGFALFFCLYHSPRHLGSVLARVGWAPSAMRIMALLTLAALGIAAALLATEVRANLPATVIAASFMTLSLLTIPHMLVPPVVGAFSVMRFGARGRPRMTL